MKNANPYLNFPGNAQEAFELHAMFTDRFGVGWMINYTGSKG